MFKGNVEMRKKICIVFVLLVLISILTGCTGGVPTTPGIPVNEEARIKSVINEYFLAVNNKNWNLARSYCVYGGERYYATSQMQSLVNSYYAYCSVVTVNFIPNIINVYVTGNYAQAYLYYYGVVTACGYSYSDGYYTTYILQKIGNSWKIS